MRLPSQFAQRLYLAFALLAIVALLSEPGSGIPPAPSVNFIRVPNGGIQPQIVERNGVIHLLYFTGDPKQGDLSYVTSLDYGKTFSKPIRVNSTPGTAVAAGNIRGGQLAVGGASAAGDGTVHVAWIGSSLAQPRAASNTSPVLYSRLNKATDRFEDSRALSQDSWGADGATLAAGARGNVYVFWHAQPPDGKDETQRRLWMTRSNDGGETFGHEHIAYQEPTGVCGCCGSKALAGADDTVYVLFRAATQLVHRDMFLLSSVDHGASFQGAPIARWDIEACVMSSASLVPAGNDVLAAWESEKQVSFGRVDHSSHKLSAVTAAPGAGSNRKYPMAVSNRVGDVLFVWTENMGWSKGGSLAWQLFDRNLAPMSAKGEVNGVPAWSLVSAFARPDGDFTIIY